MVVVLCDCVDIIHTLVTEVEDLVVPAHKAARGRMFFNFFKQDRKVFPADCIFVDNFAFGSETVLPVEGDISVKRKIIQDSQSVLGPSCCDKQPDPLLFEAAECFPCGFRNFMGHETCQGSVNIKENSLDHISFSPCSPQIRYHYCCTSAHIRHRKGGGAMTEKLKKRWFGTADFYRMVLAVAVPVILQSAVTNFVNMLDNMMIGQVGTLQMSAVSIVNQLLFIFNITVFGCVNAAGIFSAQYYGKNDMDGVRNCLRLKLLIGVIVSAAAVAVFTLGADSLVSLYLDGNMNSAADIAATLVMGREYLMIMVFGLPAFAFSQCVSSTMRDSGETMIPMISSFIAVGINFVFNFILIFGHLGFPRMGIHGAALATVISRYAELFFIIFSAVRSREKMVFFQDIFRKVSIPLSLVKNVALKGTPLIVNEFLWSIGMAGITQCYSTRGLEAVAALNIYSTVNGLFIIFAIGMGTALGIIVGQQLGAGDIETAKQYDIWMLVFSICVSAGVGVFLWLTAPVYPQFYNTSDAIRASAVQLLRVAAVMSPFHAVNNACYFTMRCGGKTLITFLSDGFYTTSISWLTAFILSRFTSLDLLAMLIFVSLADVIKAVVGVILVESGIWINNLVAD